jgi:hypothetical protein
MASSTALGQPVQIGSSEINRLNVARGLHTRSHMMRLLALGCLLGGCLGSIEGAGGTEGGSTNDPGPDAGGVPATGTDGSVPVACDEPVATGRSGGEGPTFTLGGTVYDGVTSTTPVVGATVRVVDAAGNAIPLVTAQNGNFWTTAQITFPVTVSASRCPDVKPMVSPVTQAGGDCNMAGCHTSSFRVHLP